MNNKVRKELQRIAAENGGLLKPVDVVEAARPLSSPLHSKFQWDDTLAAHQYRLEQARLLIRVCVTIIPNSPTNQSERVYVSLARDRKESGYRTLVSVLSDREMTEELLNEALEELEYFERKFSKLEALAEVFRAVKKVRIQKQSRPRPRA